MGLINGLEEHGGSTAPAISHSVEALSLDPNINGKEQCRGIPKGTILGNCVPVGGGRMGRSSDRKEQ